MCDINSIISNLIIGAIGSLIASFFFLEYTKRRDKAVTKEKYGKAVGVYVGYGAMADNNSVINKEKPLSNIEIKYLEGNLLQLTLREINHPHEWQGIISMESNYYGTIIWRYKKLHNKEVNKEEHLFGLKKFVFFPKDNLKVAYLMGDKNEGYLNEILIESRKD